MRTSKIFIALAMTAATVALGSCSNDEVEVVDITKPINLNVGVGGVTQTRVTIADNATFEEDNSIGLFMGALTNSETKGALGSITKFDNTQYTLSGSTWSGNSIYWQNTADYHTIYAYSPYQNQSSVTDYKIPFTLKADQAEESGKNYKAVDFLWSAVTTKATSSTVPIELSHKMSLIKVTLAAGSGMTAGELAGLEMSILATSGQSISADGVFNLNDGTCTAADSQTSEALTALTPYRSENTFYAIVMPGTVFTNASDFIKLTATDGTVYLYKLGLDGSSNLTMVGGNKYEFTLSANKKGITLTQFTISSWGIGDGDNNGNANMVI